MHITVTHDFSSLEAVLDKFLSALGVAAALTSAPVKPAAPIERKAPASEVAAVERIERAEQIDASPAHPGTLFPNEPAAPAAPVEQPKRGRGRPSKAEKEAAKAVTDAALAVLEPRPASENMPAPGSEVQHSLSRPIDHSQPDPALVAAPVAATPARPLPGSQAMDAAAAGTTPPSADEIRAFKDLALRLANPVNGGDKTYLDIRAKHGNPRVAEMTRPQFDAFMADVKAALEGK